VLWGIVGFLALQLGMGFVIEGGLWGFRDPWYQHKIVHLRRQWHERTHGDASSSTRLAVMLGSSRTGNGLKGTCFEEEMHAALGERWTIGNIAVQAGGPVIELIEFRRLLAEGIRPDLVLIEVTSWFLSEPVHETFVIKSARLTLSDLDCVDQCDFPTRDALRLGWWSEWGSPWYAHRFSILSEVSPMFLPCPLQQTWASGCDRTGWIAQERDPALTPEGSLFALKVFGKYFEPSLRNYHPCEPSRKALRAILEECRRRDIPAALVRMPEGTRVRDWYSPAAQAGVCAVMAELQTDFGVTVIDGSEWIADSDFSDQIHLLADGADAYTRRLAQQVAPLLRRSAEPQAHRGSGGSLTTTPVMALPTSSGSR
jgi:hypothetical protein